LSIDNRIALINGNIFNGIKFKKGIILIKKNLIEKVKFDSDCIIPKEYKIIDCSDKLISYGFIDPHVHFRSPGMEHKEDWKTGSRSALKGGYTFVIDMPNTNPPTVDWTSLLNKYLIAKSASIINFGFHLGLTEDNVGSLSKIFNKAKKNSIPLYGIKVFFGSSTGQLLVNSTKTIEKSLKTGIINLFHAENETLIKAHEDIIYKSVADHNIKRPPEAEVSAIKIICKIIKQIKNSKGYICHISTKNGIKSIIKGNNKKVLTEVTPHHLFFCTDNITDSNIFKVNPPIRDYNDNLYIRKMFNKGKISVIGTDHAPHLLIEKQSDNPPSGLPGLETSVISLLSLYEMGILRIENIFKSLTNGYKIFNIKKRGKIKKGNIADLTIIKKENFRYNLAERETKADFSPFEGTDFSYKIDMVIINGKILLKEGCINDG